MAILAECPTCRRKQAVKNKVCACGRELDKAKRSKKVRYWINYLMPNGKQRREPVGFSIEDARTAEGKRRTQKYENPRILERVPEEKMTFKELTDWYLELAKVKALSSYWRVKISLEKFNQELGTVVVGRIRHVDLENYQAKRKAEGLADATVDQEIGAARTMIIKAFNNDMVSGDTLKTFKRVSKLLRRNANARDKILPLDQFKALMTKLPHHARAILATAFYTGMRMGEILGLSWDKVDLKGKVIRLEAQDTKDKEPRTIPLCPELVEILRGLPRALHEPRVFYWRGRPVKAFRGTLQKACKATGIPYGRAAADGFVFHDLRHTFNTNMRKAGVAESVIMEVTGHSTREMFDRYNTVDAEDTRKAVDQMSYFLRNVDQNVDQATN
jgi:integrase